MRLKRKNAVKRVKTAIKGPASVEEVKKVLRRSAAVALIEWIRDPCRTSHFPSRMPVPRPEFPSP